MQKSVLQTLRRWSFLWFSLGLAANLSLLSSPVAAVQSVPCESLAEVFGFTLENYRIDHQHGAIIDIEITYRLITTMDIDASVYPDFVPIAETIDRFLTDYPNDTDFWEILNKKLAQSLLDRYPQMSGIRSRITVTPSYSIPYERFSEVTMNRPNHCPLDS